MRVSDRGGLTPGAADVAASWVAYQVGSCGRVATIFNRWVGGGFEFPLLLLALGFVISAVGAGSYSINHWLGVSNWDGIEWSMSLVGRAAIALAIGVGAGLATGLVGHVARSASSQMPVGGAKRVLGAWCRAMG
jgi:hypothetical protein